MQRLKVGISACLMHPDPGRKAAPSKTLHFIEQSMAHWVGSEGALAFMVPSPYGATARGGVGPSDYAAALDGLVMHGGVDVSPTSYGETPVHEDWVGDRVRDDYEIALVNAFVEAGKPVFGVCRGMQLLNVAHGGTLYQDLSMQVDKSIVHRDPEAYDLNLHDVDVMAGSRLQSLVGGSRHRVNSIHHQGIKALANGFAIEAVSPEDGVIEAIRYVGDEWIAAVQWHPEFHRSDLGVLDDTPLLRDFLDAARAASHP